MSENPNPNQNMHLRAENDGDRTPEFKGSREQIVNTVDTFLKTTLAMQMAGNTIKGHAILWQPVVTETDLGPTGPRTKLRVTEAREGISLTGDGESTPLSLQYVKGDVIIKMQGSDPMVRSVNNSAYSGSSSSIAASFYRQEGRNYYGADIRGDGAVRDSHFREADGMNVYGYLRKADDIEMLQAGLQSIMNEIIPQEAIEKFQA